MKNTLKQNLFINFAKRFKALRNENDKTLDDLKSIFETTKATLSRYENYKSIPDANFIIKAALYFNVTTDYLLGITDFKNINSKGYDLQHPLIIKYNNLNDNGQIKTLEYIDDLLQSSKYLRSDKKNA